MEKIKVGEYVRTISGNIGKYIIQQNINYIDTGKQYIGIDIEKDIVKQSSNIIDLIEVGDYVNGYEVRGKTNAKNGYIQVNYYMYSEQIGEGRYLTFDNEDIKKS